MNTTATSFSRIGAILAVILLAGSMTMAPISGLDEATMYDTPRAPDAKGDDFSHSVVLELFVTTWCGYCPSAEAVAKQLNSEYAQNFMFVTMVCDENEKADARYDDYGTIGYPDGVFDGNYRREVGGQSDTSTYESAIDDSGNRDVPDIDLSVNVADNGDGTMEVGYSATYKDMFPFYDAHLRVYIVERASRYPDVDDHAIPYGFIDYAFDEDISLTAQVETTDSTSFRYDDYENATFSNFVIIATLFDKTTGVERYAVASATTETTNIYFSEVLWTPEEPSSSDVMTVTANISGDVSEVTLEYSICTAGACGVPSEDVMQLVEGTLYTLDIGKFNDDAESVHIKITAQDPGGNKVRSEMFDIEFGHGSGGEEEGIFSNSGTVAASGAFVVILVAVLGGLFMRNRSAQDELKDLQERLDGYENTGSESDMAIEESVENEEKDDPSTDDHYSEDDIF